MKCPRCTTRMAERVAGGCHLFGCPSCGGVWLSARDSARLAQQFPLEAVQLADAAARATERRDHAPSLRCPTCDTTLARNRFRASPGGVGFAAIAPGEVPRATELVELDVCAEHGTFFDGGELPRTARAIHVARNNGPAQPLALDPDPREAPTVVAAFGASLEAGSSWEPGGSPGIDLLSFALEAVFSDSD